MKLRPLRDIRSLPLLVGMVQALWAIVPACDMPGFLFRRMLDDLAIGRPWGWAMMLSGLYLVFTALVDRRESLHIALFLCAMVWSAMTVLYFNHWYLIGEKPAWITPITLVLPLFSVNLWFALAREMLYQPVIIKERRRCRRPCECERRVA